MLNKALLFILSIMLSFQAQSQWTTVDSLLQTGSFIDAYSAKDLLKSYQGAKDSAYYNRWRILNKVQLKESQSQAYLDTLTLNFPDYKWGHYFKAMGFIEQGRNKEALPHMNRAIVKDAPAHFYFWRAVIHHNLRDKKMALVDYEKAQGMGLQNSNLFNNLGIIYAEDFQYAKAVETFNKALAVDSNNQSAINALANISIVTGNLREAQKYILSSAKLGANKLAPIPDTILNGDKGSQLRYIAVTTAMSGDFSKSIDWYKELEKIDQCGPADYLNIGYAYYKMGKLKKAEKNYKLAEENIGDSPSSTQHILFDNMSLLYNDLEKYDKTVDYCNKRIALDPYIIDAYLNRGSAWQKLGDFKKAKDDFEYCLRLDVNYVRAYAYRGHLALEMKAFEQALEDAEEAIRRNANYGYGHVVKGYALYNMQRPGFCASLKLGQLLGEEVDFPEECE
ncbi:MAG: hypothetical protein NXI09_06980 [Bacteroidetes bacterium]|nr:hypothetical protein [Bacteroidota bacterium]